VGTELGIGDDPRPPKPARAALIRLLLAVLRVVAYPWLAFRRARAAPRGAWIELEIDGRVPELPAARTLWDRFRGKRRATLSDVRALALEMAADAKPRGLLVTLKSFEGGMASALSLRETLLGLRKAGRRVVVHLPGGADTKAYFVASAADHVYAFPGAEIALLGFASGGVYVREALAKSGVVAEVLAHGKYKSAGESLTRDAMSEAQREQLGAILDRMYVSLTDALRTERGLSEEDAKLAIDQGLYRIPAAVTAKLVDAPLFDDEVPATLSPSPASAKPPPHAIPALDYLRARRATKVGSSRGPCIGVVRVHGGIARGESPFGRGALESNVIASVRAARENRRVRGVLLHVDSPGGSALASARMHRELELLASEKPLVVSMANVAASGGYYVAAPAHAIVAQPLTITGSIGVISARFALGPVLGRLGVHMDTLKRGARADLYGSIQPLRDDERRLLEHEIAETYDEFVEVVARGRKKSVDEIHALAQGRVWTGEDAHARGLVDVLGGFDVALAEVRRRVGKGGDGLQARVVRGSGGDGLTWSARPTKAKPAAWAMAEELLGEWADAVPLLLGSERVLLWAIETMPFLG
jgi:protease-4